MTPIHWQVLLPAPLTTMPALTGVEVDGSRPLLVRPCSYGFAVIPGAKAPACL